MSGIAFEHSIRFPPTLQGGQTRGDVRSTFRSTMRSTYRRQLEGMLGRIRQGFSEYPHIAALFRVEQESGAESLVYRLINEWDNWWVLEYDIPAHQMPPNPNVPIQA